MSSPRLRMGPTRTVASAALAALLFAPSAFAQRVTFVSRSGAGVSAAGIISARACPADRWTFRAASGDGARTDAPEVWLARGTTCTFDPSDPSCARATAVTPTREASCDAGVCWAFTLPGGLLVDPLSGACTSGGAGSTAVIVRFGTAAAAFPDGRIGWDTAAPAPPSSVTVSAAGESEVSVSWTYPSASADAGADDAVADADVADVTDVGDVMDLSDAGDVADATDADDVADAADADVVEAGVAPSPEPLGRYWLLCDPATGVDAGVGECPSGGFAGLDVDDDRTLEAFSARCARGSAAISASTSAVTLTGLAEGQPYRFAVVAEDLAGNRSVAVRATRCASAQRYTDFWERYRADGGGAAPGCSASPRPATGGGGFALLALVLWSARRQRQRKGRPSATLVAVGTDVRAPAQP
jgi:MYXO-CTERM domain-containing protein